MSRRAPHPRHPNRAALLLLAALAGSGCTDSSGDERGTPLPEPPDGLPRPDWDAREGAPPVTTAGAAIDQNLVNVPIGAAKGLVAPNTQVWAINLDNLSIPPVLSTANAQGGFSIAILASDSDRVRILSRTDQKHSPPLDLLVIAGTGAPAPSVQRLPSTALSCLTLTPPETVVLSGSAGTLELENHCKAPLQITRAELRLGDRGIRLSTPPSEIAAGAQASLTFADSVGPAASERLEILLLEVDAGSEGTGRYAIDLFSDLE